MDRKGVNKIKCSSSHETCVRWCLNRLRAVKGLMWRFTSCYFSVVLSWSI